MPMQKCLVLRLVPPAAIPGAEFTGYLSPLTLPPLTVTVFDISYKFAAEGGTPPGASEIGSVTYTPIAAHYAFTGPALIQHVASGAAQSVATAVIVYPGLYTGKEFIGPDLRIQFEWGGVITYASRLYYDVPTPDLPTPLDPNSFQFIPDNNISAYVTLPTPPAAGSVSLAIPADGTPPIFADLLAAVRTVLASDPAGAVTPAEIGRLTIDQCENIAYEIVYGPQAPLPVPADSLENMYTDPPNLGGYTDSNELSRLQFEGQLANYYGPSDAAALQLTNYVFALAGAEYCRHQSRIASSALVEFPVNPNGPSGTATMATISEAEIIFTGTINLEVPTEYFYALTFQMSAQVTKEQRYQLALGADPAQNLAQIAAGVNAGWITVPTAPVVNPAQAVRILQALNVPTSTTIPKWDVPASPLSAAHRIWTDWHAFPPTWPTYQPSDDFTIFWPAEALIGSGTPFLELVLYTLTRGFVTPGPHLLAHEIRTGLPPITGNPLTDVTDLTLVTPTQWVDFFNSLLVGAITLGEVVPPFVGAGTPTAQLAAFIRYLQQFFQMAPDFVPSPSATPTPPDEYGVPSWDLIAQTIAAYAGFHFGLPLSLATLEAAAAAAAPGDPEAQAWAVQAVWTINELFILATLLGPPAMFEFSVMEALFARGFTSREEVQDLSFPDFQQALTGTVAYDFAAQIYANAGSPFPIPPPPPPGFGPINPCCLTDCIPPFYLSPLGPVAYLHEMLRVSERSTCEDPFAHPRRGTLVSRRTSPPAAGLSRSWP